MLVFGCRFSRALRGAILVADDLAAIRSMARRIEAAKSEAP
jgi:hypothetical protein